MPTAVMMGRATPKDPARKLLEARHICLTCKRKFPNDEALCRHENESDVHRKNTEKRETNMKRRKKELIMAARVVRERIMEADEALQDERFAESQIPAVQNQKAVWELQLQQLLGEYGQAQEIIENSKLAKEEKQSGVVKPKLHEVQVGKLLLSAGTACWQSNKDVQEDRYIIDIEVNAPDGRKLAGFAVLDGHSGSTCVEYIVEKFQANLQMCLSRKSKLADEHLTKAVHEACMHTDEEFLKIARQTEILDGSTMILALVYPQEGPSGNCKLLVACIGDSRAVLCKAHDAEQGEQQQLMAVPLSEDHKPNRPDEQRRIEGKGGIVDFEGVWRVFMPGPAKFGGQLYNRWGLAVSRSFGDLLLKEAEKFECLGVKPGGLVTCVPEIRIMPLNPDTDRFVVLASDGVWDVITNEDAVGICAAQKSAELASQRLLRHVYASNTDDNITAVVLSWKWVDE